LEYYLHIHSDGREDWYYERVWVPVGTRFLTVFICQDGKKSYQHTRTANITLLGEPPCMYEIKSVPPRGAGWEMFDNESDNYTEWRRPGKAPVRSRIF